MARVVIIDRNSPGVIRDLPGELLPPEAWTTALNARFRNGLGERYGGRSALGVTISPDPFQIFPFKPYNLDPHALFAGATKVWISDGTTTTDITGASVPSAVLPNDWTFTNFNGIPTLNQRQMKPQVLPIASIPGGPLIDLPNWPATWLAGSLRSYKNVLVAMNISKAGAPFPNLIATSSITDPGAVPASWDNTDPATLATENALASSDDDDDISIVDGQSLKDIFIIYKHTTATVMAVGGQNIFTYNKTFDKGALNRNCIVRPTMHEARHVVVGLDDIYIHNGYTEESVLEDRLRKWLFDQFDPTHSYLVHAVHNRKLNEIYVPYPEAGASYCTHAWLWNYKKSNQSIIELNNTYSLSIGSFPIVIAGSDVWDVDELGWEDADDTWGDVPATALRPRVMQAAVGGLYVLDEVAPSRTVTFERTGLAIAGRDQAGAPIWDTEQVKIVNGMWPRFKGTGLVNFYIGTSDNPNEAITWSAAKSFNMANWARVDCQVSGRILHVRFEATDTSNWRFLGYDLELQVAGQ